MSRLQHFHYSAQACAQIELGKRYLYVFHDPHQTGHTFTERIKMHQPRLQLAHLDRHHLKILAHELGTATGLLIVGIAHQLLQERQAYLDRKSVV